MRSRRRAVARLPSRVRKSSLVVARPRQRGDVRVSPRIRRTFRALAGRRLVIEGFGPRSPVLVAITGGAASSAAWLSPAELRRLVAVGRKILRR
jgi:hypothetical protein